MYNFKKLVPEAVSAGLPTQLLSNRPDIRQAELELTAAKGVGVERIGSGFLKVNPPARMRWGLFL